MKTAQWCYAAIMTGTVLGMRARLVWLLTVVLSAGVVLAVDKGSPIGPDNVWTRTATRFMYAPTIGFDEVPGAIKYKFVVSGRDRKPIERECDEPVLRFADFWERLPVGYVNMVCEPEGVDGRAVGDARSRFFWKKAPFKGGYPKAKCSYAESARKAYDYLFGSSVFQHMAKHGTPDPNYALNCYPAKMNAAIVRAMVHYAKVEPTRAVEAMDIARKAADYLISVSEKPGAPLAGFPPTYAGEGKKAAKEYAGQIMIHYPADAAEAYLDLYGATRERRYLDAALAIGERFLALQGEDGTWTLKLRCSDGSAVNPNRAFPISQAKLLERLHAVTRRSDYRAAADRAFAYVDRGPLTTWNWEAQFEDAPPEGMYANLDMHSPTDAAIFCLERFPGDARRVALAKDLMKFVEDQFVDWEPPYQGCGDLFVVWGPYGCKVNDQGFQDWITPAVEEQYRTYSPVDASAAKVALGFLACFRATGERTYLEKARALADTATRVQRDDGSIPTWWNPKTSRDGDWINCMALTANMLEGDWPSTSE